MRCLGFSVSVEHARFMAAHFARLCAGAAHAFTGEEQRSWLQTMDRERENVRAALEWAVDCGDARVVTVTSFLASRVGSLPLRTDPAPAAWHDPCWLGRGMGEYDDARALVTAASAAEVAEPEHTRERAWCAGGGMGYAEADPAGADEILRRRVAELRATGAAATVTACPTAAARLRAGGLDAFDLADYLVSRLEGA